MHGAVEAKRKKIRGWRERAPNISTRKLNAWQSFFLCVEAKPNCAACGVGKNPYIKYKHCQRRCDDDFAPQSTYIHSNSPARSLRKFFFLLFRRTIHEVSTSTRPTISPRSPFLILSYPIPNRMTKSVGHFGKRRSSSMSSVYIEWVKLNIVPSRTCSAGALAKNCTHAQTHDIRLYWKWRRVFFPSLFVCAARVFAFAVCEPGDLISEFFAVFLVFVGLTHVDKRVKERKRSLSKEFNYECTNEINSVKFRANCLSLIGTGAEIKYMTRGIC